jgi:hypothetical protein
MRKSLIIAYVAAPLQCIILGLTVISLGHAQSPPATQSTPSGEARKESPPSINDAGEFVSREGRFSISLPQHNHEFRPLSVPTPFGNAKGIAYVWNMKEGSFVVGYAEASRSMEDSQTAAKFFNTLREHLKKIAVKNNGRVGPEKQVQVDSHPGLEQRLEMFTGSFVQRTYIVGSRVYQTLFIFKSTQEVYESSAAGVLDSFKVLSETEVVRP